MRYCSEWLQLLVQTRLIGKTTVIRHIQQDAWSSACKAQRDRLMHMVLEFRQGSTNDTETRLMMDLVTAMREVQDAPFPDEVGEPH